MEKIKLIKQMTENYEIWSRRGEQGGGLPTSSLIISNGTWRYYITVPNAIMSCAITDDNADDATKTK